MTGGTLTSEPSFSPPINASWALAGADFIHNDPDGKRMRLDAHGAVKDQGTGGAIYMHYTGVVVITEALAKILGAQEEAVSTEFGDSCELARGPGRRGSWFGC